MPCRDLHPYAICWIISPLWHWPPAQSASDLCTSLGCQVAPLLLLRSPLPPPSPFLRPRPHTSAPIRPRGPFRAPGVKAPRDTDPDGRPCVQEILDNPRYEVLRRIVEDNTYSFWWSCCVLAAEIGGFILVHMSQQMFKRQDTKFFEMSPERVAQLREVRPPAPSSAASCTHSRLLPVDVPAALSSLLSYGLHRRWAHAPGAAATVAKAACCGARSLLLTSAIIRPRSDASGELPRSAASGVAAPDTTRSAGCTAGWQPPGAACRGAPPPRGCCRINQSIARHQP